MKMTNDSQHEQQVLENRPEARGFRIEQLLNEAKVGRLRIPSFQRPLRWRSKNVVDLFDSIRRGFPIGELLFLRKHAVAATVNFGPVAIPAPEQHTALWVVDGQQRVTAMVAALMREDDLPYRDFWAIWYDLENQQFEVQRNKEVNPAWVPLNVLSDSVTQLKWIREWVYAEGHDELVNRLLELGKAIREYEIPAYIVESVEEKTLRLIFTRVNSSGVRMRESEIFEALYGVEGDKPIRSAVARLADSGFGALDEDLFLRCLRSTCNPMPKSNISLQDGLPENAIQRTEFALRRTIQTIIYWAGIPFFKLLPYRLPLYLLCAFYDHYPKSNTRVDRLAARWIWRGAISGEHENSTDAKVSELVDLVRASKSAEDAMSKLIGGLGHFDNWSEMQNNPINKIDQKISLKSAASRIFILGLLSANPHRRDVEDEGLFDFEYVSEDQHAEHSSSNAGEIDDRLYMPLIGSDKLGSDIIIRLSRMNPSIEVNSNEFDLHSFLLNESISKHASQGKIGDFRRERKKLLINFLREFVTDRIGDRTDVRPSITSITSSVGSK